MRTFQIFKNKVNIVSDSKEYTDSIENFKLDSGLVLHNLSEVIYDSYQECCIINGEFKNYPNDDFEGYINNINSYINAKKQREYTPPPEPTLEELKEQKLEQAKELFAQKRDAIRWVQIDNTHTYGFDCASEDITNFLAAYTFLETQITKSNTTMYKVWLNETEKGIIELNIEQMNKVFSYVRTSQFEAYAWLEQIQNKIEACQSKEELGSIILE